jgi:Anaphase-promoting complex subunit 11 RING-H2 finger
MKYNGGIFLLALSLFILCCWFFFRARAEQHQEGDPPASQSQEHQSHRIQVGSSTPMESDNSRVIQNSCLPRSTTGQILVPSDTSTDVESQEVAPTRHQKHEARNQSSTILSADFGEGEVFAVDESACTICLVEYQNGDTIQRNGQCESTTADCNHIFHAECITRWIQRNSKPECPCCRKHFAVTSQP